MVRELGAILFVLLVFLQAAVAQGASSLSNKVEVLEEQVQRLMQKNSQLQKRLEDVDSAGAVAQDQMMDLEKQFRSRLLISGYADVEYVDNSLPDSDGGFRMHHFSLVFTKNIDSKWRLFSEIEFEDAPSVEFDGKPASCDDCSGTIFLEAMNISYSPSAMFGLKAGRFFTPAGIWSEDHYPPFVKTQERPLHIRKIFPQLVDGAMGFGRLQMGETFLNYQVYSGNGEGNPGSTDENSSKAVGVKLALLFPLFSHFELGASYYKDTLNTGTDKVASGAHFKLRVQSFHFQGEYAKGELESSVGDDAMLEGYYTQLFYNINHFDIGYRYDFFDKVNSGNVGQEDEVRNSLFVNWKVQENVVLKLEYHEAEPQFSDNYTKTIVSLVAHINSQ